MTTIINSELFMIVLVKILIFTHWKITLRNVIVKSEHIWHACPVLPLTYGMHARCYR